MKRGKFDDHPLSTDIQIAMQEQDVAVLFPDHPGVRFSLRIPDIHCAGCVLTITPKGWLWCAFNNALTIEGIELGEGANLELFERVWLEVEKSMRV